MRKRIAGYRFSAIPMAIMLLILLTGKYSLAQTGPGGVGSAATNKLWLKAGDIGQADGTAVSSWPDASGNGNDAAQGTAANQPTYKTGVVNGNSAIRFDGANDYLSGSVGALNAPFSIFAITYFNYLNQGASDFDFVINLGNGSGNANASITRSASGANSNQYYSNNGSAAYYGPVLLGQQFLMINSFHDNIAPFHNLYVNGTNQAVNDYPSNLATNGAYSVGAYFNGSQPLFGFIPEVVIFNYILNNAERIIVENYLSSKYGIVTANDFFAYDVLYGNDLIGIGREDASNQHTAAQGQGVIKLSGATSLGDGDYLLMGHDNAGQGSWTTTESPSPDYVERLPREWKLDETGDVGNITITIDVSTLPALNTGFTKYYIMIDADGDFSSGPSFVELTSIGGNLYEATGVSINDGDVIAIATVKDGVFISTQSGNWNTGATWVGGVVPGNGDTAVIAGGHTVTNNVAGSGAHVDGLIVSEGGVYNGDNKKITIDNYLIVDGTYSASNGASFDFTGGAGTQIGGTGTISIGVKTLSIKGNTTIQSAADLVIAGKVSIDNGVTVTNNGILSVTDVISGGGATATFVNGAGATLKTGGATLMGTGVLDASANGNTIEYNGSNDQDIKCAVGGVYWHLAINGTGIKSLTCCTDINGDLLIKSADLNTQNFCMSVAGDWTRSGGTFTVGTATVTFDGTSDQTITALTGETFYDFTVNKGGGTLNLSDNAQVNNTLTMTAGNIDCGSDTLILGYQCANIGTLTYTAGTVIGPFKRWVNGATSTSYTFPVGVETNNRPVMLTNMAFGASNCGTVTAEFVDSSPGNAGLPAQDPDGTSPTPDSARNTFIEGYWTLEQANSLAVTGYDLVVTPNGFNSFTVHDATRLVYRPNSATDWAMEGLHASPPNVTRTGMSTMDVEVALADTVNCDPPVTSAITGDNAVCKNEAGVAYSVTNTVGSTYDWTLIPASAGTIIGDGNSSITINWGDTGVVATLKVEETNACTRGAPVTMTVNVHTIPPSSISGKTNIAINTDNETYAVTGEAGYTYTWFAEKGTVDAPGTGTSVSVDWGGTSGFGYVKVLADSGGCPAADTAELQVKLYVVIESIQDGHWENTATWDCGCEPNATTSIRINNGDSVWIQSNNTEVDNLIINSGGVLHDNNKSFTVNGDLTINGTYRGDRDLPWTGEVLDGTGSLCNTNKRLVIQDGAKEIAFTANLQTCSNVGINVDNATVTNNGILTVASDLTCVNSPTWIQGSGSTLNVGGTFFSTCQSNIYASATGNTINFNASGNQNIPCPNSSQYYHLTTSGSGDKALQCCTDVNGNLLISGTSNLDCNNNCINLAGNWTSTSTFAEQTATVTFDGTAAQIITNSNDETFYNLTINNTSGDVALAANTDIIVTNNLTLTSGNIILGANIVSIESAASITGGSLSSHIVSDGTGYLRQKNIGSAGRNGNVLFPVGHSTTSYNPVTLNNGAGTVDQFDVRVCVNVYDDGNCSGGTQITSNAVDRTWNITEGLVGGSNATVTLQWDATHEMTGFGRAASFVSHHDGTSWSNLAAPSAAAGADPYTQTATGVNSFSPFGVGETGTLPIELIDFSAEVNYSKVNLAWATATEINNDFFTVERTRDGTQFETVAIVDGSGNSNKVLNYKSVDEQPYTGVSYYRLKQTDFDGKYSYSKLVQVNVNPNTHTGQGEMLIHPNPSDGNRVYVSMTGMEKGEEVLVVLMDMLGNELYSKVVITDDQGQTLTALDPYDRIPAGMYIIIGTAQNEIYQKPLVVK